jgi:uncharacterized protein HemX
MSRERPPADVSTESSTNPARQGSREEPSSGTTNLKIALVILALVAATGGAYGWLQHRTAQELISSRQELQDSLTQARSQAVALTVEVNALSAAQAQEQAARAQEEQARAQAESAANESALPAPPPQLEHRPEIVH